MGQYFYPVVKTRKGFVGFYSHNYDNGLKLMEHSWIGNNFTEGVVSFIKEQDEPVPVAWVGDYSDSESLNKEGPYFLASVFGNDEKKRQMVQRMWDAAWRDGRFDDNELPDSSLAPSYYLLNWDKMEYVYVPACNPEEWQVHPLPVLTCSNPGSGGNYRPRNNIDEMYFCSWCGDHISYSVDRPSKTWKEIFPEFKEN